MNSRRNGPRTKENMAGKLRKVVTVALLMVVISSVFVFSGSFGSNPPLKSLSGQAFVIEQDGGYPFVSTLFNTGYLAYAAVQKGIAKLEYTPYLLSPPDELGTITIYNQTGSILSVSSGPGYYVCDDFNFSFVNNGEYFIVLSFENIPQANITVSEVGARQVVFYDIHPGVDIHWRVTLGNETINTLQPSIMFLVMPGNYTYSISADGFAVSPSSGTLEITQTQTFDVPVSFTPSISSTADGG